MAFPWVEELNFEDGTSQSFSTEVDTESKLRIAHYSELAAIPGLSAPFRGAYCMDIDFGLGSADAYVADASAEFIIDAGTEEQYIRFMLFISNDYAVPDATEVDLAIYRSASADQGKVVLNFTDANGLRLGIGQTAGTELTPITRGQWHTVEVFINPAGGGAGFIDWWLDNVSLTRVGSLTQLDITSLRLGTINAGALASSAGHILFDMFVADAFRIFPFQHRFPDEVLITKSQHIFMGSGKLENISLLANTDASDGVVEVYDTDTAYTDDASNVVVRLQHTAAQELVDPAGVPVNVRRGCYVSMSGTNPRALAKIGWAQAYASDGAIRSVGARRRVRGANG